VTEASEPRPILVLGGTSEARHLATALDQAGLPVVSSLAGRVSRPHLPPGEVRIGGFGGADGLARWLRQRLVRAVVDATHPFADQITEAAIAASRQTSVPLLRLDRPAWTAQPGDRWHRVGCLEAAAELAGRLGHRLFLTIGRQGLAAFAGLTESWLLIRCVEPPDPPLPPHHQILLARGPFNLAGEVELLERHTIEVLVTRDSGGAPTEAKLEAARQRGIPVVVVERPPGPDLETATTVTEAVAWIAALMGRPVPPAPEPAAAGS
jgi:precorrin-6A/cobalt-precorrin-6A reductase